MRKIAVLVFVLAVIIGLFAVACGGGQATTTIAATTTTENPLVGVYTGSYQSTRPKSATKYAVDFQVKADGTIVGNGALYTGTAFEVHGTLANGASFSASGDVQGAGMTVTFDGAFSVKDGVVTASGTWKAGSSYFGTWTATKGAQ